MPSFFDFAKKAPAPKSGATAGKSSKPSNRSILFGTGFTKRLAQTQQRALDKTEAAMPAVRPDEQLRQMLNVQRRATQTAQKPTAQVDEPEAPEAPDASIVTTNIHTMRLAGSIDTNLKFDEYQLAALEGLRIEKYGCLIGSAGTGKTTVTKHLVSILEEDVDLVDMKELYNKTEKTIHSNFTEETRYRPSISFSSFTGRAVQQIKRALPREYHSMCHTIHATLGFYPEPYTELDAKTGILANKMRFVPYYTAANKMPWAIFVIDECGMVPIDLWNQFIAAMRKNVRIIMIGDINQLPPVMGRSVLGFAMLKFPTFELKHIHRQAADNPIIANAHKVLHGLRPKPVKNRFDVIVTDEGSLPTFQLILRVVKWLHNRDEFNPFSDAIIVPQNKNTLGQINLNESLTPYFNPERKESGIIVNKRIHISAGRWQHLFATGDKVMLLANNNELGLTNGMIGIITSINLNAKFAEQRAGFHRSDADFSTFNMDDLSAKLSADEAAAAAANGADKKAEEEKTDKREAQRQASHIMTVEFQDGRKLSFSTVGQFGNIAHAYAFTCHKSQGGEYPTVIICAHSANSQLLSREWLYTAITRAKERIILICNERGLSQALRSQRIHGNTLEEKAHVFIDLQKGDDTNVPMLPAPEKVM